MCLIIDTNRFGEVFADPKKAAFEPLLTWVLSGGGAVVYGGQKYKAEIGRHRAALRFFSEVYRSGQAFRCADGEVDAREAALQAAATCKSDDQHVLAIAQLSGARVLCTEDEDLIKDFKNPRVIPKPKGCVYRNASHRKLLGHNAKCRLPKGVRKRRR